MPPVPTAAVRPFTAQELVDAIHAAIDAENLACEHPARTEPVAGVYFTDVYFLPREADDMVDVSLWPPGTWEVWDRDTGDWTVAGDGLESCVEAALDALDALGVL